MEHFTLLDKIIVHSMYSVGLCNVSYNLETVVKARLRVVSKRAAYSAAGRRVLYRLGPKPYR